MYYILQFTISITGYVNSSDVNNLLKGKKEPRTQIIPRYILLYQPSN